MTNTCSYIAQIGSERRELGSDTKCEMSNEMVVIGCAVYLDFIFGHQYLIHFVLVSIFYRCH